MVVSSGAAAAPARRKTAAATRTKHSVAQADVPAAPSVEPSTLKPAPVTRAYEPSYDEIATLAYSYWTERGFQGGSPEDDWLRAEQELRTRVSTLTV